MSAFTGPPPSPIHRSRPGTVLAQGSRKTQGNAFARPKRREPVRPPQAIPVPHTGDLLVAIELLAFESRDRNNRRYDIEPRDLTIVALPFSIHPIWGLLAHAVEGNPSHADTYHGEIEMLGEARAPTIRIVSGLVVWAINLTMTMSFVIAGDPGSAFADDPKAREIMERVDRRDDGDNETSNLQMILIDKRGKQRVRELRSFRKDKGEDAYSMLFFMSPADVKDTGFLTYDYDDPDRDDDQWLYLPALKKTKRIASSNKSGSFMGSDFSYADMTDRPLEKYDFTLLQESEIDGHPVWVIQAVPTDEDEIDETGYTKSIHFIRKDNFVVIRAKIWLKKGKRNKYMEVKELAEIDGIWVAKLVTMTTKKGKQTLHKTILRTSDVKFDQPLDFDSFSVRGLEAGP